MNGSFAVWPQGRPDAARFTPSPSRALLLHAAMTLATVAAFGPPTRVRVHHDPSGRPDPDLLDAA